MLKIGIDLCSIQVAGGGKDAVSYNLLKGFAESGVAKHIFVFCNCAEMAKKVKGISNDFSVFILSFFRNRKKLKNKFIKLFSKIRTFFSFRKKYKKIRKLAVENELSLLLFADKDTPPIRFPMPTVVWENDIKAYSAPELCPDNRRGLKVRRKKIKADFKYRDYIVAISEFDQNEMIKFFPKERNKIIQIYNPIQFSDFPKSDEKRYITALNIQWTHKNIFTLIKAFNKIKDITDLKLLLIGRTPPNYDDLKHYVQENDLEHRVIFAGFVSDEELEVFVSQTRLYVNPSLFEGFGMTAIEMMGNMIPTITARTTSMPEVTMGLCKYYSPATDDAKLAKVIAEELSDPISEVELCKIAELVRAKYSYKSIADECWKCFTRLVKI